MPGISIVQWVEKRNMRGGMKPKRALMRMTFRLEGGEGPEDPLGGSQLEEVEPPEGAPEEHREHAEALGQGDDHQVPVG
jgi:hypothetical protein